MGKSIKEIDTETMKVLKKHPWRGNIRELKNIIERAMILCNENILTLSYLPVELKNPSSSKDSFTSYELANAEKIHIQNILKLTGGNKTRAAQLLKIALTTLYRKISEYNIHS